MSRTQPHIHAGRPPPTPADDFDQLGAYAYEGQRATTKPEAGLEISFNPPAAAAGAAAAAHAEDDTRALDVGVLLGGCGDARHLFAAILEAGSPRRTPKPKQLRLRLALNDIHHEVCCTENVDLSTVLLPIA